MQLLSKRQLANYVPFSPQHIQRLENEGKFPKRLKPADDSPNAKCFWVLAEVEDWIKSQIDVRDSSNDSS